MSQVEILEPIELDNDIKAFRGRYDHIIKALDLHVKIMSNDMIEAIQAQTDEYASFFYKKPIYKLAFKGLNEDLKPLAEPNYEWDKYGFMLLTPEQFACRPMMNNVLSCACYGKASEGRAGQNFYLANPFWMNVVIYKSDSKFECLRTDDTRYGVNDRLTKAFESVCEDLPNILVSFNACILIDEQEGRYCVGVTEKFYGEESLYCECIGRFVEYMNARGLDVVIIGKDAHNDCRPYVTPPYVPQILGASKDGQIAVPWKYHDIPNSVSVLEDGTYVESYKCYNLKKYAKRLIAKTAALFTPVKHENAEEVLKALLSQSRKGNMVVPSKDRQFLLQNKCGICHESIEDQKVVRLMKGLKPPFTIEIKNLFNYSFRHTKLANHVASSDILSRICASCQEKPLPTTDNGGVLLLHNDQDVTEKMMNDGVVVVSRAKKEIVCTDMQTFRDKTAFQRFGVNSSEFYVPIIRNGYNAMFDSYDDSSLQELRSKMFSWRIFVHRSSSLFSIVIKLNLEGMHSFIPVEYTKEDGTVQKCLLWSNVYEIGGFHGIYSGDIDDLYGITGVRRIGEVIHSVKAGYRYHNNLLVKEVLGL